MDQHSVEETAETRAEAFHQGEGKAYRLAGTQLDQVVEMGKACLVVVRQPCSVEGKAYRVVASVLLVDHLEAYSAEETASGACLVQDLHVP